MKFAHLADIHLGSWREDKLSALCDKAFVDAVTRCLQEQVDFVLIAGDLFDTALPAIDKVKLAVDQFRRLHAAGIPVYAIAGSHDYSPTGKTMLEVLGRAGVLDIASKAHMGEGGVLQLERLQDPKTGAVITGIPGRKGMLDRQFFEILDRSGTSDDHASPAFRIFLFHTALTELKPKGMEQMESQPESMLPEHYNYYAAGHVHVRMSKPYSDGIIVYPGALFPCSIKEMESAQCGFALYDAGAIRYVDTDLKVVRVRIDANRETCAELSQRITAALQTDVSGAIVTLRIQGVVDGRIADLRIKDILDACMQRGALIVLKNTAKLISTQLEHIRLETTSLEHAEEKIMEEHLGKDGMAASEKAAVRSLMAALASEKQEGETNAVFEDRIALAARQALGGKGA